jgi:hypothetical protein
MNMEVVMNEIINDYFFNAQLSFAVYANFENVDSHNYLALLEALTDSAALGTPMSEIQARSLLGLDKNNQLIPGKGFEVVDQYTDPNSGFSTTLFKNRENSEYTFAVRGTQPSDFINDIVFADTLGIALDGKAQEQINAMNAYFGRLITPEALGGLGLINQDVVVNVTGHSLGGHLATVFTLFWRGHVKHAYTYNGAGTGDEKQGALLIQLKEILGFQSSDPIQDDLITNLFAYPGLEITTGLGIIFGNSIPLFIEDQGTITGNLLLDNHSISLLTDALAVYDLLGTIQNTLSINTVTQILKVASNEEDMSLEAVVSAISKLFNPSFEVKVRLENVNVPKGDRDKLYTNREQWGQIYFLTIL